MIKHLHRNTMALLPAICLILTLMALPACSIPGRAPIRTHQFDLSTKPFSESEKNPLTGPALMLQQFHITPAFDSYSFIYRTADDVYTRDYYNEFIIYPAKLITDKFAGCLFSSREFIPGMAGSKETVFFRLSGKITKLYADLRQSGRPCAVMEIGLLLEKKEGSTFRPVLSETYSRNVPVSSHRPIELIRGWSRGLSGIVRQFTDDVRQTNY